MRKKTKRLSALLISTLIIFSIISSTVVFAEETSSNHTYVEETTSNNDNDISPRAGILSWFLNLIFGEKKAIIDPTYKVYTAGGKTRLTATFLNEGNVTGVLTGELRLIGYNVFLQKEQVVGKSSINSVPLGVGVPYSHNVFPLGSIKDFDYFEYELTLSIPGNTSPGKKYKKRISKQELISRQKQVL